MAPAGSPEHVGSALRHRRELVQVSLQDIIDTAGAGHVADVKWIEGAVDPSLRRIMWHYAWVATAAERRGTWKELPYAQRQQWYDTALDESLWQAAVSVRSTRLWWWGRLHERGANGAVCFVCGQKIEIYDAGRPMSNPIRIKLMTHRALHSVAGTPAARSYQVKAA